jgi:hypothetical protein
MMETDVVRIGAEHILIISGSVVALTQLVKWAGLPDRLGPLAVLLFSLLGVLVWGYSESTFERTLIFSYFAGWISVALSAAGVFGFTRAGAEQLVRAMPPPSGGAGSSHTIKETKVRRASPPATR